MRHFAMKPCVPTEDLDQVSVFATQAEEGGEECMRLDVTSLTDLPSPHPLLVIRLDYTQTCCEAPTDIDLRCRYSRFFHTMRELLSINM